MTLAVGIFMTNAAFASDADPSRWWNNYMAVNNANLASEMDSAHADCGIGVLADMTTGIHYRDYQISTLQNRANGFHNTGRPFITYQKGQGLCTLFLIEWDTDASGDTEILRTHWSNWTGVTAQNVKNLDWCGMHNFILASSTEYAWATKLPGIDGNYARLASDFSSLPDFEFYNGTDATDWEDIVAASSAMTWENEVHDANYTTQTTALNSTIAQDVEALIPWVDDGDACSRWAYRPDSSNPWFKEYAKEISKWGLKHLGASGVYYDNVAGYGVFGRQPYDKSFGNWAVACFEDYLDTKTGAPTRPAYWTSANDRDGDGDYDMYDYMDYQINSQGRALDGTAWQFDEMWRAFLIYKRDEMRTFATEVYDAMKEYASTESFDFPISGNGNMWHGVLSKKNMDILHQEMNYSTAPYNSQYMGLPPYGRSGPDYEIMLATQTGRFCFPWHYIDPDDSDNPNLHKVLSWEGLAHNAILVNNYKQTSTRVIPKWLGTTTSIPEISDYILFARDYWGARKPVANVAVVQSDETLLESNLPDGLNGYAHGDGYSGWCTYLGNEDYQYEAIKQYTLSSTDLSGYDVIIVPHAEVFGAADVSILETWVRTDGGNLIVTGDSGYRKDSDSNWNVNYVSSSPQYTLYGLTGVADSSWTDADDYLKDGGTVGNGCVIYIKDNVGQDYYLDRTDGTPRVDGKSTMDQAFTDIGTLAGKILTGVSGTGTSQLIATLFEYDSSEGEDPYYQVDLVNLNLNVSTDVVTATGDVTLTLKLPSWVDDVDAYVISPDIDNFYLDIDPDDWSITSNVLTIDVGAVTQYKTVVIEMLAYSGRIWAGNSTETSMNQHMTIDSGSTGTGYVSWETTGCESGANAACVYVSNNGGAEALWSRQNSYQKTKTNFSPGNYYIFRLYDSDQKNKLLDWTSVTTKVSPSNHFGMNYWPGGYSSDVLSSTNWTTTVQDQVKADLDHIASLGGRVVRLVFVPDDSSFELSETKNGGGTVDTTAAGSEYEKINDLLGYIDDRDMKAVIAFENTYLQLVAGETYTEWEWAYNLVNYDDFEEDAADWMEAIIDTVEGGSYDETVIYYDINTWTDMDTERIVSYIHHVYDNSDVPQGKIGISLADATAGADAEDLAKVLGGRRFDYVDFPHYPDDSPAINATISTCSTNIEASDAFPYSTVSVSEFGRSSSDGESNQESTVTDAASDATTDGRPYYFSWMLWDDCLGYTDNYGWAEDESADPRDVFGGWVQDYSMADNPDFEEGSGTSCPDDWSYDSYGFSDPTNNMTVTRSSSGVATNSYKIRVHVVDEPNGNCWIQSDRITVDGGEDIFVNFYVKGGMDDVFVKIVQYDQYNNRLGSLDGPELDLSDKAWKFHNYLQEAGTWSATIGSSTAEIEVRIYGSGTADLDDYLDIDALSVCIR
jgi:hypothetical protein